MCKEKFEFVRIFNPTLGPAKSLPGGSQWVLSSGVSMDIRAVVRKHREVGSTGLTRQVDLPVLIKEVVVSPFSPAWLESIVSDLLRRYDVLVSRQNVGASFTAGREPGNWRATPIIASFRRA
jgi:hypothetical protein